MAVAPIGPEVAEGVMSAAPLSCMPAVATPRRPPDPNRPTPGISPQGSTPLPTTALHVPCRGRVFADYAAGRTVVTDIVTHEKAVLPGDWSVLLDADGDFGPVVAMAR